MPEKGNPDSNLNEIVIKIKQNLKPVFTELFSELNHTFENLDGIKELISWYKKIQNEDNNNREKIIEDIINECMKHLPQEYGSLCIENIKVKSQDKKQHIKFDINFQLEPIKSYVEFAINVNKIRKKTGRIVFETNSNVTIRNLEIVSGIEKKSKEVSMGILSGVIQISIIEIPFMKLNESIELGTKEIEIDLSQYSIIAN